MGSALVAGLLAAGHEPSGLGVVERLAEARTRLGDRFPGIEVTAVPVPAEAAVLAVKPVDADAACAAVAQLGCARVLSVVAGVGLERLSRHFADSTAVIRAMPNVAALLGSGASAIAAATGTPDADLEWAELVLGSVGLVVRVAERQLDAVTGLSGSGPAYVFLLAEALIDAGVQEGLDREVASSLVLQTILGSARMLVEGDEGPAALRHTVVSPGGTTAAGLRELERHGFRSAVQEAVAAATERSRQLGSA